MDYPMLLELVRTRRSVREFADRRVERTDVERLIEAARWAPSNHNRQGWKFLVFEDRGRLRRLAGEIRSRLSERLRPSPRVPASEVEQMIHYATLFADAPCVILAMHKRPAAVASEVLAGENLPELVSGEALSTAMAVENMLLAAHSLGLGACVMTAPLLAPEPWTDLPDLPQGFEPTCVIAVGYPSRPVGTSPPRKPLQQVLEYR